MGGLSCEAMAESWRRKRKVLWRRRWLLVTQEIRKRKETRDQVTSSFEEAPQSA